MCYLSKPFAKVISFLYSDSFGLGFWCWHFWLHSIFVYNLCGRLGVTRRSLSFHCCIPQHIKVSFVGIRDALVFYPYREWRTNPYCKNDFIATDVCRSEEHTSELQSHV